MSRKQCPRGIRCIIDVDGGGFFIWHHGNARTDTAPQKRAFPMSTTPTVGSQQADLTEILREKHGLIDRCMLPTPNQLKPTVNNSMNLCVYTE